MYLEMKNKDIYNDILFKAPLETLDVSTTRNKYGCLLENLLVHYIFIDAHFICDSG